MKPDQPTDLWILRAQAILKDSWDTMDVDNPLESVQETVFFRLAEFCYLQGLPIDEALPDVNDLFSHADLSDLSKEANFRFAFWFRTETFISLCFF